MLLIKKIILDIEPLYNELNKKYSKAYLSGSSWYVGDDLIYWWDNYNIRYYSKKKEKLKQIIEILIIYQKNKKMK